jgi:hypothetical protein
MDCECTTTNVLDRLDIMLGLPPNKPLQPTPPRGAAEL